MNELSQDKECRQRYEALLPKLSDYVDHWARLNPEGAALVDAPTGETVSWKTFSRATEAFAAKLLSLGLVPGDVVATTLPLTKEHIYLMFACFRLGLVVAPLDLRLKTDEISRYFKKIRPKAYFFLGNTPVMDFRPMVAELMEEHRTSVTHWVQFQKEEGGILPGAVAIQAFAKGIKFVFLKAKLTGALRRAERRCHKRSPAVIIFTTGSTGEPKPALLCHESILVQCIGMAVAFSAVPSDKMLINLPPSHVGCLTEELATIVYVGGTGILVPVYTAEGSMKALSKYGATMVGQVPAQYNLEWLLPDYAGYDRSALRFAVYGGQAVSDVFLGKLTNMAPAIGTGLGLTETAGFCTYLAGDQNKSLSGGRLGFDSPLCPITIREPMGADGKAGRVLPAGEVGEICFAGPQLFSGYLNDPVNTAKTLTVDGVCYTGDMGSYDAEQGLKLAGRRKHIIKPKGYQVFPAEVENFIATRLSDRVANVACVGMPHEVFSEAILAFVEPKAGSSVTAAEVMEAAKGLAAYARPSHVEMLPTGGMPLNRVAKTDYLILKDKAEAVVAALRTQGAWDIA